MEAIVQNETVQHLLARRSIRRFRPDQISEEMLQTIIQCGFAAPSGMNLQSWHLVVVQDAALLEEINTAFVEYVRQHPPIPPVMVERLKNPLYSVFFRAPTCILVCYETEKGPTNSAFLAENMAIAAQSLGLGTCYVGGVLMYLNTPEGAPLLAKLQIPEGYTPAYFLCTGYPDEAPDARPRDLSKITYIR